MGILGIQSAYGFSDRLFNSFDIDKDGSVLFTLRRYRFKIS